MINLSDFKKISDYLWEIPISFRHDMRVPARIYATEKMLQHILDERAIEQLINVATLPGVYKYALAMPDIHQGYGFPIGGVAAIDAEEGVISPAGIGYDINCGVRLLASQYNFMEIKDQLEKLSHQIQRDVPSGVGRGGQLVLKSKEFDRVLQHGMQWAVSNGYALQEDLDVVEERGCFKVADAKVVSEKAKKRGADQLGTLGAGNHFLEIQQVTEIYDEKTAQVFGLFQDQITVMIHTGSRGFGHQVCTDYVHLMNKYLSEFKISLPDRELTCVPFKSEIGQQYYAAMAAAANFAWTNRQLIANHIRRAWQRILGGAEHQLRVVYDVAHNIAKLEKHFGRHFIMHRKGATRAFGPGSQDLPDKYKSAGQPVIIPGSMGTASYVLVGTKDGMENSFGSACHGAGRQMSRAKAKRTVDYQQLLGDLQKKNIIVRGGSAKGLIEEAPQAYKDIEDVIDVVDKSHIARKVVKLKPLAVVKG
ncbi:MAG: RtcB family protein [Gammaproteobacteria bacterium]|jgi:tRNA-splicing ligase RtcB